MTHLIQIGNSRGIRISLSQIEQAGLDDAELELKVVPIRKILFFLSTKTSLLFSQN